MMDTFIKKYKDIGLQDIVDVGYKNAAIGKVMRQLSARGVLIPDGFALSANAYRYFIQSNGLEQSLKYLMADLDKNQYTDLKELSRKAVKLIMDAKMPADLGLEIIDAYDYLFDQVQVPVAVRSSLVSSHLADAAAEGLNNSFMNVQGHGALLYAVRQCFASVFTERAIKHAMDLGYDPTASSMSVGIQQMIRADKGGAGIGFTHHPDSGAEHTICLKAIWGLGELINHEPVEADIYTIGKPSLQAENCVVNRQLGGKARMMVFADEDDECRQTILKETPADKQQQFVLTDDEIRHLARWALLLDGLYAKPMCFEWAKDGVNHKLYLLQVSPFKLTETSPLELQNAIS